MRFRTAPKWWKDIRLSKLQWMAAKKNGCGCRKKISTWTVAEENSKGMGKRKKPGKSRAFCLWVRWFARTGEQANRRAQRV
jgi:hypothetical protein